MNGKLYGPRKWTKKTTHYPEFRMDWIRLIGLYWTCWTVWTSSCVEYASHIGCHI